MNPSRNNNPRDKPNREFGERNFLLHHKLIIPKGEADIYTHPSCHEGFNRSCVDVSSRQFHLEIMPYLNREERKWVVE